jgi:lipopolysaccharide export system permease protein
MRTIIRYYLREFFRFFFLSTAALSGIFVVVDFLGELDIIYEKKPPLSLIVLYFLLFIPKTIFLILPMACLFSVLLVFGLASKWKEIVAIRALGGSLKKLSLHFFLTGILISSLSMILGETLVPFATTKAKEIRYRKILKKRPKVLFKDGEFWVRGIDGSIIHLGHFVYNKKAAYDVSIFRFDKKFKLTQRIEADSAFWTGDGWKLNNLTIYEQKANKTVKKKSDIYRIFDSPEMLVKEIKRPEEMNFFELYTYYQKFRQAGHRNLKYEVDLWGKLTLPIINFVMMLFGVTISFRNPAGGGLRAMGNGMIVTVLYWVIYSLSMSFGYAGKLPPWSAPWISPALFSAIGIYLFKGIQE